MILQQHTQRSHLRHPQTPQYDNTVTYLSWTSERSSKCTVIMQIIQIPCSSGITMHNTHKMHTFCTTKPCNTNNGKTCVLGDRGRRQASWTVCWLGIQSLTQNSLSCCIIAFPVLSLYKSYYMQAHWVKKNVANHNLVTITDQQKRGVNKKKTKKHGRKNNVC